MKHEIPETQHWENLSLMVVRKQNHKLLLCWYFFVLVAGNILYPNVPHQLITCRLNTILVRQSFLDGSMWIKLPVVTYWKEISLTVLDPTPPVGLQVSSQEVKKSHLHHSALLLGMEYNYSNISGISVHTHIAPHAPLLHENKSSLLVFILSQNKKLDFFCSQPILILILRSKSIKTPQNPTKQHSTNNHQIKRNTSSSVS